VAWKFLALLISEQRVVEDAVDDNKDSLFAEAADVLLQTLEGAVNRIGDDLKNEMGRIGRKVCRQSTPINFNSGILFLAGRKYSIHHLVPPAYY
jgi:hypothetical protein